MEALIELHKTTPEAQNINLEFQQISNVAQVIPKLMRFKNLKYLSLAENRIKALPNDLSMLRGIESLNLNNNLIKDVMQTAISLKSLPHLKALNMNLNSQEEVDFLIRTLPNLEFLNGLNVDRDELEDSGMEQEPSQNYGEMESGMDVYDDRFNESAKMKNSQHPQQDSHRPGHSSGMYGGASMGGASMGGGAHGGISTAGPGGMSASEMEHSGIGRQTEMSRHSFEMEALPESPLFVIPSPSDQLPQIDLSPQALEQIAMLYDNIRDMRAKIQPGQDMELTAAFDQHLTKVMNELKDVLEQDQSRYHRNAHFSRAKHLLYEICSCKAIEHFKVMGDKTAAEIFSSIRRAYNEIITGLIQTILIGSQSRRPSSLQISEPPQGAVSSEGQDYVSLKASLAKAEKETADVLEAAEQLEQKVTALTTEKESLQDTFAAEKQELLEENKQLQEENKKLLETLIRHSKGQAVGGVQAGSAINLQSDSLLPGVQGEMTQIHQSPSAAPINQNLPSYHSRKLIKGLGLSGQVGPTQVRSLTLKQLKDLINEIYNNKVKYDQRCEQNKLPRETMEQYMYTFLNQRYGLKSLIIEWAAAIINGIRRYSRDDHDVALFGKILRNQCDEEFRFIQQHVKDALLNFLKQLLKEKFIHKTETDIQKMIEQVQSGFIEDWMWRRIINRMYEQNDVAILEQKFNDAIVQRVSIIRNTEGAGGENGGSPPQQALSEMRKLTREEKLLLLNNKEDHRLLFSEFQKIVLDFQLREHEKFLRKFFLIFKTIDVDNNGIIDEDEFKDLIKKMGVGNSEEEVNYFLQIVDPYNNNQMTFSEIVHLFSAHMVPDDAQGNKQIPLLEKFSRDMDVNAFGSRSEF